MEDGLRDGSVKKFTAKMLKVLILVLVEDGLRDKFKGEEGDLIDPS